jgi:hypothetical protein
VTFRLYLSVKDADADPAPQGPAQHPGHFFVSTHSTVASLYSVEQDGKYSEAEGGHDILKDEAGHECPQGRLSAGIAKNSNAFNDKGRVAASPG